MSEGATIHDLSERLQRLSAALPGPRTDPTNLKSGDGGGTSDGMGPWEQSVDRRLDQLHSDQRDLLRFGIAAFVLAFTAIIGSFFLLSTKIEDVSQTLSSKMDGVGQQISALKTDLAVLKATDGAQQPPPCPAGMATCKPWERQWETPPK
jgi:hypothetical protein